MVHEVGHVIDGKYRLVRLLGTGGMGAVYEGENLLIRRRVAIKILHAGANGNVDAIRRFEREAQAAGQIGNDHILEVLDIGSLPNGDRYLVMEYLDGETLAARIARHGRLTPEQIAPIARQFLTALASAHAAGIIHRDLKPENIFILWTKAGRIDFVKLIDFGISKFSRPFNEGEQRMTRADAVLGTPVYMSPEQARGARETDVRSDIYSCGVILYESVTGRVPFDGESFNDLMFKIALSDAPSPLSFVPSLDPDFAGIIDRAIARDPSARFGSAEQFAAELDEWMRKNALADMSGALLPSDAFPVRVIGPVDRPSATGQPVESPEAPTLSPEESDAIRAKKSAAEDSWSHSKGPTTAPGRPERLPRLAALSAGGLAIIGLAIAFVVRADPAPRAARAGAEWPASSAGSTSAPVSHDPLAAPSPAVTEWAAAVPARDVPPSPTSASNVSGEPTPSSTSAAGVVVSGAAAPNASTRHEPIAKANASSHGAAPPPTSSPSADKPRPKATTVSAKGFDLGY